MESVYRRERVRRHLLVVLGVGVLVALSAVMASTAQAAPAGGKATKLTPEQRERFAEGARKIAGLSEKEISRALRNPDDLAAIPVGVEGTLQRGPAQTRDEERSTQAFPDYCTYLGGTLYYVNVYNQKLFTFTGTKQWCFDYTAVTSAPPARVGYSVTAKGREEGWQYVGLIQRVEGYRSYAGIPRGSHVSTLTGGFRSCSTGAECTNVYPQFMGVGRYDGTGVRVLRTLPGAPAK